MRKFVSALVVAMAVIPASLRAQSTDDTLLIRNTGIDAMRNVIMGDTLADGGRANLSRVYVLERGQRYVNGAAIVSRGYHLRIVGQPAPASGDDPGPAVVQHSPDSSGHYDSDRILDLHGDLTMKNVWILAWVADGHQLWEPILEESDSTHVLVDHCIFEWAQGPALHISAKWTSTYLTNDLFRNANYTNEWWAGRVIYYTAPADKLVEINNTVENVGFGLLQSQGIGPNYFFCDHNTVVNCAKFCFLESYYTTAYIADNLFVNCHFTGEREQDRPRQDPDLLLYGQTINIDTLIIDGRTLAADDPRERDRIIVYSNNATYFDTTDFYRFYRMYNDTVALPSGEILSEPVMNSRTRSMWSWHPHMSNVASIEGENPNFTKPPLNMDLIFAFLKDRYSPSPKNDILWGYDPDSLNDPSARMSARNLTMLYPNASGGTYPTPEDFSYTSSVLLTGGIGGFPVGDLNWFPDRLVKWTLVGDVGVLHERAALEGTVRPR